MITNLINRLTEYSSSVGELNIMLNESLSEHTSFRIGGEAKIFVSPRSISDLQFIIDECNKEEVRWYVLGKGTNVVFSDDGFNGCVISLLAMSSIALKDNDIIVCDAGANLTTISKYARDNSLTGFEFAAGIPGTIGGAVFMNAGAFGGDISGVLLSSTYLDITTGKVEKIDNKAHDFSYRHSVYMSSKNKIILSCEIKLNKGSIEEISSLMEENLNKRKEKQPLEYPSAGSVFKRYEGYIVSKMIDECGLKGTTVGGAQVSTKHAGFIVNVGNATCRDVKELVKYIKKIILERYKIEIECEILFVE